MLVIGVWISSMVGLLVCIWKGVALTSRAVTWWYVYLYPIKALSLKRGIEVFESDHIRIAILLHCPT